MENSDNNLVAIIMAGGVGTRFWPLSTQEKPKQFIQLFDDRSLLQKSYDRVAGIVPDDRILVLTNADFTRLVKEQLPEVPPSNIIGEPERKDTAAAICLGVLIARKRFGNPVIIVLTADHLIEPLALFQRTMLSAVRAARESGALYTFGIKPTYPAVGYGYLEVGEKISEDAGIEHFHIVSFKEKPEEEIARQYVESGRYLWNSGMFVWTADAIFQELTLHLPGHVENLGTAVDKIGTGQWEAALQNAFATLPRISIDFAVMEKAREVRGVAGEFCWKDVGGWLAIQDFLECDASGNYIKGRVHALDAQGNLVFCDQPQETLAMVGVKDVVVVRSGAKTLVAHKDRLEDVKHVVESMLTQAT
uniref:mannose-1-phosphate guanylyltransferase n=1 Tax=Desulfobacca acetoxidans TaxID=60893 RepID=A0A7V6A5Y1_9BACT